MHQTNPTELCRERNLPLLREGEDRRRARRLRRARGSSKSGSSRRMTRFRRAVALWGRIGAPFFRA